MIKPSTLKPNKQEQSILDLEKKYMLELKGIFQSQEFKTHLKDLIKKYPNSIAESYESPPLAIPFERLIHFHFYRHFRVLYRFFIFFVKNLSGGVVRSLFVLIFVAFLEFSEAMVFDH